MQRLKLRKEFLAKLMRALLHTAFSATDAVEAWAAGWSGRLESSEKLAGLKLQRGFTPISETLSNHEYPCLWDVIFDRHPILGRWDLRTPTNSTFRNTVLLDRSMHHANQIRI